MLFPMLTPMLMPMLMLGTGATMAKDTMAGTEDIMAMAKDLLMLSQMPNQLLMLMLMLMLGTVPMAMVLVIEDMVDTMVDTMPDHMDIDTDTGERRRGLLMPSLQLMLMPMPTLGMDITDMHIVHMGMGMD